MLPTRSANKSIKPGSREANTLENKYKKFSYKRFLCCFVCSTCSCTRSFQLWTTSNSSRRLIACGRAFAWNNWCIRTYTWGVCRKFIFNTWTYRFVKHHSLVSNGFCCLLPLQTNTKRVHHNRNLHGLLNCPKHNSRYNVIVRVVVTTITNHCICVRW